MRGGISFGADNTFTGYASLSVPLFAPAVYRTLKLNRTQIASAVERRGRRALRWWPR